MLAEENPNDESRFLMENQLRSDFFICRVNVGFMCIDDLDWIDVAMSYDSTSFSYYKCKII
ncbi:hypothetical protein C0132_13945 [Priestia aryabhattai]|uniref:Uncharacterized protein n=1 Tax=Priestia megaterium TaxID=1404 RepID=A0AAX6BKI3_PRIMG|nr:hypothetical protein COI42_07395 [Priestia aryabhattai]QFY73480.1 hypothetical protein CEQ83_13415 [Priestia megaterium]GMG74230.1 hypothetical protein ShirakiTB12_26980 [Priestia megaterium]